MAKLSINLLVWNKLMSCTNLLTKFLSNFSSLVAVLLFNDHWQIWVQVFQSGLSKICARQPQTISLQIFYSLSSTNFTWSILEYSVPFICIAHAVVEAKNENSKVYSYNLISDSNRSWSIAGAIQQAQFSKNWEINSEKIYWLCILQWMIENNVWSFVMQCGRMLLKKSVEICCSVSEEFN